jgi:hypothetical protein
VTTTRATVRDLIGHWTTERLKNYVRLMCRCIEAMERRGNFAYLTKHAIERANCPERYAKRTLKEHANATASMTKKDVGLLGRPLSIAFDDWWFVMPDTDSNSVSLFLRDAIFGHLILVCKANGDWVVKTVADGNHFKRCSEKKHGMLLKNNFEVIQNYLMKRIAEDAKAEALKNVDVNKATSTDATLSRKAMFDAMNHENLMRLRAHLDITESPTKGKPGRPSKAAYRAQVRKHIDEHNLWSVMNQSF